MTLWLIFTFSEEDNTHAMCKYLKRQKIDATNHRKFNQCADKKNKRKSGGLKKIPLVYDFRCYAFLFTALGEQF